MALTDYAQLRDRCGCNKDNCENMNLWLDSVSGTCSAHHALQTNSTSNFTKEAVEAVGLVCLAHL